jgi:hypothetical protein
MKSSSLHWAGLTTLVTTAAAVFFACSEAQPNADADAGSTLDGATTPTDAIATSCLDDAPTGESLEAARIAIRQGATKVPLSPRGCLSYERVLAGSSITSEKLLRNNSIIYRVERSAQSTQFKGDFDQDGFFEWTKTVTRGEDRLADTAQHTDFSATTKLPTLRKTYSWITADKIRVVKETADAAGKFGNATQSEVPRLQGSGAVPSANPQGSEQAPLPAAEPAGSPKLEYDFLTLDCSEQDAALFAQRMREALDGVAAEKGSGGLACMHRLGQSAKEMRLTAMAVGDIKIVCVPDLPLIGEFDGQSWFDSGTTTIRVNPTKFNNLSPFYQRRLLLHEMLHEFGEHDTEVLKDPRVQEIDPTEACASTCFQDTLTTKCSCATCLGTDICDPRCKSFKDCDPVMGAQCNCPFRTQTYPSCTECLTRCPSGLGCFGYTDCTKFDVSCKGKKSTCR